MKKIISAISVSLLLCMTARAYTFPQPNWGSLRSERKQMETASDFELYVEGSTKSALYCGARLEPAAGVYIGTIPEYAGDLGPLGSYLTTMEYDDRQKDLYAISSAVVSKSEQAVTMVGWNITSLENIDYDYIGQTLETLNRYGKPMIIRFANEMNCSNLGDDPDLYVEVFRNVANMIHQYPNFAVVWSPNDMGALDRPFEYFYPGDEYVDWIGVSCYMTKYFMNEQNTSLANSQYFMTGDYAWATNKLKPLMKFMSDYNINKPVMISEGGVARYNSFGDDYSGWHEARLRNMLWNTIMKYPQIKMINYFNRPFQTEGEHYYISDYAESVSIFNEAASGGAYIQSENGKADFVFSPANGGETLAAESGIVRLYTLAYFANIQNPTVTYKIDGVWYHESNQIPYICNLDVNGITDGKHTLTITSGGTSKSYDMYKSGRYICFGNWPDTSLRESEKEISVVLNGNALLFVQPPIIVNDRTLVPMRAIFEAMGAEVNWRGDTQTVTASLGSTEVKLTIGSGIMLKNGEKITLDAAAYLEGDYTMIPVRAVTEAFGAEVSWNDAERQVTITCSGLGEES